MLLGTVRKMFGKVWDRTPRSANSLTRLAMLPRLIEGELGRPAYRRDNPILEGKLYVFRQPIWDAYSILQGTALTLQKLFLIPQGQQYTPGGGAAQTKSVYHTFMTAAGVLPSPQKYFTKGLSIYARNDLAEADAARFFNDTVATFFISGRPYFQGHAHRLPASGGISTASTAGVNNGWPDIANMFTFFGDLGEVIEQLQSIQVELDPTKVIDAAAAGVYTLLTTANGGNSLNAFAILDGLLNREIL